MNQGNNLMSNVYKKSCGIAILVLLLVSGCKKDATEPASFISSVLESGTTLRDISFINDTLGFICGGAPNVSGKIWKTTNGGASWHPVFEMQGRCLYDAAFLDPVHGYAGGDSLLLLRTTDGGITWTNVYANEDFSGWSEFIRPIRKIAYPNPQNIIAVGGDLWYKGLMCVSHNWGENWFFKDFNNQLNDIEIPVITSAWVCGYGLIMHSADTCSLLTAMEADEDFFTGLDFLTPATGLACGYNGGLYKTADAGETWKIVLKPNGAFEKRIHFNDITFIDDHRVLAAGNTGLLMFSTDQGETWSRIESQTDCDLLSITVKPNGEIWLCGSSGFVGNLIPAP